MSGRTQKVSRRPTLETAWRLPTDFKVTAAGSRVHDWQWDFRQERGNLSIASWDCDVMSGAVCLGRLSDGMAPAIVKALQEAVAIRWRFRRPEDGRAWHATRAMAAISEARAFAAYCASVDVLEPGQITDEIFYAYVDTAIVRRDGKPRTRRHAASLVEAPLLLWKMRQRTDISLGFVPENTSGIDYVALGADTMPIPLVPKVVLDQLIGSALDYVEVFAPDIIAMHEAWAKHSAEFLNKHGMTKVPTSEHPLSQAYWVFVSRRMGMTTRDARKPWTPPNGFAVNPRTGKPWHTGIKSGKEFWLHIHNLRTAAYIVIAFFTGARVSEMERIRVGRARRLGQVNGQSDHFELDGEVIKHQGDGFKPVAWSLPEVAFNAVDVLTRSLAPFRTRTGSDYLFVTRIGGRVNERTISDDLKRFCASVTIPYVDGKPYPISTHVLRVALAQWLGLEPYGELAGAFHLNQLSTIVFRGYLRENQQFKSQFENYGIMAQADHLEILLNEPVLLGRKGAQILADRSPEEQHTLERNVRALNLAQVGRCAPPMRTIERMKKAGISVYRTKFTSCMFQPDTAECLKDVPLAERVAPRTHACSPTTCANSAMTRLSVPAYLEDYEAYAAMRTDPSQSPSQQALAIEEMKKLAALISPHHPTLAAERQLLAISLQDAPENDVTAMSMRSRLASVTDLLTRISAGKVVETFWTCPDKVERHCLN